MGSETDRLREIVGLFEGSVLSVKQMANFDRLVLQTTISLLETTEERLRSHGLENPRLTAQRALDNVRNIQKNDSLRPKYEEMFNQCAVLLVSHFGAALGDLFRFGVALRLAGGGDTKLNQEELKLTVQQIADLRSDPLFELGDLIMQAKDLSFQDMQSTCRAFRDWIGIDLPRSEHMDNVIIGQAARHAIVHTGGRINEKLLGRARKALTTATLGLQLERDKKVQFTPDLVDALAASMTTMIDDLASRLTTAGNLS